MGESTSTMSEGKTATLSRCIVEQQNVESCAKNVSWFVHCFCSKPLLVWSQCIRLPYAISNLPSGNSQWDDIRYKARTFVSGGCTVALHCLGHAGSVHRLGCGSYGITFRLNQWEWDPLVWGGASPAWFEDFWIYVGRLGMFRVVSCCITSCVKATKCHLKAGWCCLRRASGLWSECVRSSCWADLRRAKGGPRRAVTGGVQVCIVPAGFDPGFIVFIHDKRATALRSDTSSAFHIDALVEQWG